VTIRPSQADVGWWASAQTPSGQIGQSALYAGVYEAQVYISTVRFDLSRMPRGASIQSAVLRLTGLHDDRLERTATNSWMVQLLAESTLPELQGVTFFTLYEAPAALKLSPIFETEVTAQPPSLCALFLWRILAIHSLPGTVDMGPSQAAPRRNWSWS
jgi:hypothetical protein